MLRRLRNLNDGKIPCRDSRDTTTNCSASSIGVRSLEPRDDRWGHHRTNPLGREKYARSAASCFTGFAGTPAYSQNSSKYWLLRRDFAPSTELSGSKLPPSRTQSVPTKQYFPIEIGADD